MSKINVLHKSFYSFIKLNKNKLILEEYNTLIRKCKVLTYW